MQNCLWLELSLIFAQQLVILIDCHSPMKWGEVACFLSHYQIWTEMAAKRLELVLILEDDTQFILEDEEFDLHNFHYDLNATIEEFIFHQGELL